MDPQSIQNNDNFIVKRENDSLERSQGNLQGRDIVVAPAIQALENNQTGFSQQAKKWLIIAAKVAIATTIIGGFIAISAISFIAAACAAPTGLAYLFATLGTASAISAKVMLYQAFVHNMFVHTSHDKRDINEYLNFCTNVLPKRTGRFLGQQWNKLANNPDQVYEKLNGVNRIRHAADIINFPVA